jgi:hypothetical protein
LNRLRLLAVTVSSAVAGVLAVAGSAGLAHLASLSLTALPGLLVALTVINLVRSIVPPGALVGPAVLGLAAAVLVVARRGYEVTLSIDHALAGLLATVTLVLLLTTGSPGSGVTAIAWLCRRAPAVLPASTTVICVLGTAVFDLRRTSVDTTPARLRLLVAAGRVVMTVPSDWEIALDPSSRSSFVAMRDTGPPAGAAAAVQLSIRVIGLVGALELTRV